MNKIKGLLLFEEDCITHYTSFFGAKAMILEKSKFRLSEGAFLNDTSEGRELFNFLPKLNTALPTTNDTIAKPFITKPFIGSFVEEKKHDDLALWRMYGKDNKEEAKGCAITLNRGKLVESIHASLSPADSSMPKIADGEFRFYRVAYRIKEDDKHAGFTIPGVKDHREKELNERMDDLADKIRAFNDRIKKEEKDETKNKKNVNDQQNILKALNEIAYLFKSAEYQYEYELRLVTDGVGFEKHIINTDTSPRIYIELVPIDDLITKITLGPKVERAEEWAAAFYYSLDKDKHYPQILISHLPFK